MARKPKSGKQRPAQPIGVVGDAKGRSVRELQAAGYRPGYGECPGCGGEKQLQAGLCAKCKGIQLAGDKDSRRAMRDRRVPMCGAKSRRTGEPCRNVAGMKTEHPGHGLCYLHGGSSPHGAAKAFRQKAEVEMRNELALQGRSDAAYVPVTPEQAIQWLLDTGLVRAKRWEDALQAWNAMKPAERNAIVTLSMAERGALRETAGLARRTGYHPRETVQQQANLFMKALDVGMERSGLQELVSDFPWLDRALQELQSGMLDILTQAESAAAEQDGGRVDDIEGRAVDLDRPSDYNEWSTEDLRHECSERGLRRGGSRSTLIRKLRVDDGRPEEAERQRYQPEEVTFAASDEDDVIEADGHDLEPDEPDEPDLD